MVRTTPQPRRRRRYQIAAWCCYDWADSGYTTLLITILVVYFQKVVFADQSTLGAVVWAWSFAASMLIGALLSPFLGSLADSYQAKRLGLAISALVGGASCIAIGLSPISSPWLAVGFLVFANLGHELSLTFYNGFLPEIADESEINRVSANGFAVGFFGGGLALLAAIIFLAQDVLSSEVRLRICIAGTGLWWILFTVPTVWLLKDRGERRPIGGWLQTSKASFKETLGTIREFRAMPTLFWFLIAFLIYNDGVQTVTTQSPTFALQELHFTDQGLALVILMIQFVATPGAMGVGWLADKWGSKKALTMCLITWICLLLSAWFVTEKWQFWVLATGVALVLGGTQAVSRSIMGTMTPNGQEARYFGFFNLSGKATCFLGTFFFGAVVAMSGSSRLAIVGLLSFFAIGLAIVLRLKD